MKAGASLSGNQVRVLSLLQSGGAFSSIDIVTGARVADPHKEVSRLRDKGHVITAEWRTAAGKRYKVWRLLEQV